VKKKSILAMAVTVLALSACAPGTTGAASGDSTNEACESNPKIVSMPKASSFPYYDAANVGAERAAEEIGGQFAEVAPATIDAAAQAALIDTQALKPDVCALMISANDRDALNPAVQRARAAGKTVITWDSDISEGSQLYVSQASNEAIGTELVQTLAEQIDAEGQIAFLVGSPTQSNQNAWVEVMEAELAQPEYAGMELVKIVYGEGQDQKATQEIQSLLQQYPDLRGMIAPDAANMPVAARILESRGLQDQIALTGLALPSQMRNYVKSGALQSFALWDVEKLGYLSYYAAYALATGEITGEPGDTFTAGDAGEFTINDDRQVELGPLLWFTAENVDDYSYEQCRLLRPWVYRVRPRAAAVERAVSHDRVPAEGSGAADAPPSEVAAKGALMTESHQPLVGCSLDVPAEKRRKVSRSLHAATESVSQLESGWARTREVRMRVLIVQLGRLADRIGAADPGGRDASARMARLASRLKRGALHW
jgi:rhamnose transport system substrate-binding protein